MLLMAIPLRASLTLDRRGLYRRACKANGSTCPTRSTQRLRTCCRTGLSGGAQKFARQPPILSGASGSMSANGTANGHKKTLIKTKPRIENNRVLVTGGAGFVGSHLCTYLVEKGDHVICVDNFFTGSKENIKHLLGKPNFETLRHDVVEKLLLEVDQIYHLACPASPVHYKYNPIKTMKTSFLGTMNMLGLAKRTKARFLLTSTSEVYGDPLQHPQTEEYWGNVNCIGERSCYDEGKRAAECLTFDYYREHNLEVRVVRIFNTYGPRMALDDGRVVSNFLAQALTGQPMTIYGDGSQSRSFQYVSDLIKGMVAVMNGDHMGPFNIGNPNEFTMLELAKVVQEVVDPKAQLVYRENTADDPTRRRPDISKASKTLGWEPVVPLREGLACMIEDFAARLNVPVPTHFKEEVQPDVEGA